jgi:glutamate-ammonia-ligase adenylyltransferase
VDADTQVRHARFREAGGIADGGEEQRLLDALLWQSPYLSAFLIRDPAALSRLARDPFLRREKPAEIMRREIAGQPLRRYRNQEYLRLGARELGWGMPEEVGRELSHLADACLEEAVAVERARLTAQHGEPLSDGRPCRFVVFGMGKLGGEELNFSSDIDLIYVYETDQGGCPSGLTLHEFFARLAERVTRAVGDVTEDGLCFRVDLRLRPEGSRGPVANSLAAGERYYEAWGRPWERQAWLKARPVAGDLDLGHEMLAALEPFIWPRSGSAKVIEAVHELMGKIRAELGSPGDVKVGPGGIREIEFFVQALQMVHARLPSLREPGTRRALDKLLFAGLVSEREHRALTDAYVFLRRVEHRLQLEEGRQTHALPQDRELLARRLGFADARAFDGALAQQRKLVSEIYATLGAPEEVPPPAVTTLLEGGREAVVSALAQLGFAEPDASADEIELLRGKPQTPFAVGRAIAPILLAEVAQSPDPDLALRRLVDLVGRRGSGAGIWRLVEAHRPLGTLLISLFGTSEYLGKVFVAHPELLEELLSASQAEPVRSRGKLDERLQQALVHLPFDDEEARLNALRRLKNEEVLRIGLFDIAGELAPTEVSSQLSDLAEALLEATLATVAPAVFARWGTPTASLAVMGLGKLGARELTYASDLDLVFIYSDEGEAPGGRSHFEIFSRLGQRLISALGSYLEEGRLYEVDTRLRPSGQQGTLVSSLAGFRAYHAKQALLWERQALIKLRVVAGDRALGGIVEKEAADHVWNAPADPNMAEEIGRLRARMEKELARETAHRFNIKSGRGGLLDVEFLVQYLQLRDGRVRLRSTAQALAGLRDEGILPPDVAAALADSYAFLRRLENRLRIVNDRSIQEISDVTRDLDKLARRLGYHGEAPGGRLLADYRTHAEGVRAIYARYLPAGNLQPSSTMS